MTAIPLVSVAGEQYNIKKEKNETIQKAFNQFGSKSHLDIDTYSKRFEIEPQDAQILDLNNDGKISIWEKASELIAKKILKQDFEGPVATAVTGLIYQTQGLEEQENVFMENSKPLAKKGRTNNSIYFRA